MKRKNSGFSLIELSVVIVIIGILVIGITKGSRIITEARLKTARNITAGSPVTSIPDLVLWLDATDSATIATGSGTGSYTNNPSDNDFVTGWKDRNPQLSSNIVFSSQTDANRPKYIKNGIGKLPDLSFDGTDDFLQYTTTNGLLSPGVKIHTIIVVFSTAGSTNYMFSQGNGCNGGNSGMSTIGSLYAIGCATGDFGGPGVNLNIAYVGIVRINNTLPTNRKIKVYVNKASSTGDATVIDATGGNVTIGARFDGQVIAAEHISEVIVFSRALTDNEITAIQDYLSKKYSIKM